MFKIKTLLNEKIPVIQISGELTAAIESELQSCYQTIPEPKKARVIFDFTETKFINSAGISVLIAMISQASDRNYRVEFAGLNAHFHKVMSLVGLTDLVIIHSTLEQALAENP